MKKRTCRMYGCRSEVIARGWCRRHYLRWYRHGDPKVVKDPRDYVPSGEDSTSFKHGRWNHKLYGVWRNMVDRCDNPRNRRYKYYGGKGIRVCERWYDINNFIKDMGPRPDGYMLDRIDSKGDYTPDNCRWASPTVQARNRPNFVKLNFEKAEKIRELAAQGKTREYLAEEFKVSVATIKKVLSGAYWSKSDETHYVNAEASNTRDREGYLNIASPKAIRGVRIADGFTDIIRTQRGFAKKYNLHQGGISRVLRGERKTSQGWVFEYEEGGDYVSNGER